MLLSWWFLDLENLVCSGQNKSPSPLPWTRRQSNTQVCSCCVARASGHSAVTFGGTQTNGRDKDIGSQQAPCKSLHSLGVYICLAPFPAGVLTHSDNQRFSWTKWYAKLIWSDSFYHNLDKFPYVDIWFWKVIFHFCCFSLSQCVYSLIIPLHQLMPSSGTELHDMKTISCFLRFFLPLFFFLIWDTFDI